MKNKEIIAKVSLFVKKNLEKAEGGHDWIHIERVLMNAKKILKKEKADKLVVMLALLFHDIADPKFHQGDETKGPKIAGAFLREMEIPPERIKKIEDIIQNISYKGGHHIKKDLSPELKVARDADRLDAIGAIGIARAFSYGGFKGRKLYDPSVKPEEYQSAEEYRNSNAPTLNHFDEKLLRLKDNMHTRTGKKIALKRHDFILRFLKQFRKEIKGKA